MNRIIFFPHKKKNKLFIQQNTEIFTYFDCKRNSFMKMFAHFALTTMFIYYLCNETLRVIWLIPR